MASHRPYERLLQQAQRLTRRDEYWAGTTRLARLPGARHTIFRDRPDIAFPAVKTFVAQISESQHAS